MAEQLIEKLDIRLHAECLRCESTCLYAQVRDHETIVMPQALGGEYDRPSKYRRRKKTSEDVDSLQKDDTLSEEVDV